MSVDLIVFPLPTGRTGNTGRCAVLFAPRLRREDPLSTYNDWVNWPAAVTALSFQARVNSNVVPSIRVGAVPQSAMWAAIFPPATPVTPHQFIDRRVTDLVSYPAGELDDRLQDVLRQLAANHPDGPGSYTDLTAETAVADLLASGAIEEVEDYAGTVGETGASEPELEPPDFHTWLTLLAGHPALLRALGLVVDFEINLAGMATTDDVSIVTNYGSIPNRRAAHLTMRTTASFLATSDPTPERKEVEEGWLRCADPHFSFRPTGAAELALQLGQMTRQEATEPDDPTTGGVPFSQPTGLALVRNNSAATLNAKFNRQVELNDEIEDVLRGLVGTAKLWAEDVVAGYRFDIRDLSLPGWRSLYQRTPDGPYDFPRAPSLTFTPPPDEGLQVLTLSSDGRESSTTSVVQLGETMVLHTAKSGSQRVPPNVVTWKGWSNAAPAPRRVFDTEIGSAVEPPEPEPGSDVVQLAISRSVTPGTLPELRYGRTYRIRGRAVDVAGNSLPPPPGSAAPSVAVSGPAFFGRAAIPSVTVLRREVPPVPGAFEAPLSIVLRSDYDEDDALVQPSERMVFPPQTNQWQCELHSLPDGGVDPASYAFLVARDAATLDDLGTRIEGGELLWGTFDASDFDPGPPDPEVSYLADPAAGGLTVANAPGATDLLLIPWNGAWPDPRAGRLVVRAGEAAAATRPTPDVFAELTIPKSLQATIELSAYVDEAHLSKFGLVADLDQASVDLVRQGRHAMFGQRVAVRLVHAVRRPLLAPLAGALEAERAGARPTLARLVGPVTVHGASTGSLVARATWTETVDDPSDPDGPRPVAHAARTRETTPSQADDIEADHVLELATTKRADLSVELDAISAFVDYFLEEKTVGLTNAGVSLDGAGVVASKVIVFRDGDRLTEGIHYSLDAPAGTIRRLAGAGFPNGTSVTARYVARPVLRESTEHGAAGVSAVLAPATVAPPPPLIHEVVPAYAATTRSTGQRVDVSRNGLAVRVWLNRPWLESGDGEQLAVVVRPGSGAANDRTALARDPGAFGGGLSTALGAGSLPAATALALDVDGTGDAVAAHDVRYDADRGRWASDLELRGDVGYRPWVRLALARYQADAIEGAHLSPIEYVEPLRLGPDRDVSVRRVGRRLVIIVTGSDHDGVPDGAGGRLYNEVSVQPQVADATISDPDLAWTDAGTAVTLGRPRRGRWIGELFPAGDLLSGAPVRLVVTETEPVPSHSGVGVERPVIYVETVEIPETWIPSGPGFAPGQPD